MGVATGFTGGLTLTLSLAYLTVLAHQRNREVQAETLRAQATVLNALSTTGPSDRVAPPLPTRAERAATARADLVGSAKDRWNAEVEGAVHWAQAKDWGEVREGVEIASGRLWRAAFGGKEEEEERRTESGAGSPASEKTAARATGVAASARSALEDTKARAAATADDAAAGVRNASEGAVARGIEKGKDMVDKAKAAIGLADQKVVEAAAEQAQASPVEKALLQRYEKSDTMSKSVEEVLDERYQPIGQRDNSVLRGL